MKSFPISPHSRPAIRPTEPATRQKLDQNLQAPTIAYKRAWCPCCEVTVGSKKTKQSVYLPDEMLEELRDQADRLDRPVSWVLQQAWRIAEERIRTFPALP